MKEPPTIAILSARLARAFPSLSTYSCAALAAQLEAIERAQRRHAERCCNGADGGYFKIVSADPCVLDRACMHEVRVHDPEAEERAGKRIDAKLRQWKERLSTLLGKPWTDRDGEHVILDGIGWRNEAFRMRIELQHDPRGPVLLLKLPGEAEALAV